MQIIQELDDCSIRVYLSFAEHIQYSSSFSHNHLIRAINHCYQVGQYLKHHAQKRPKILKLCLRVSYISGIILSKMFTYYSQNYAGIIGAGLDCDLICENLEISTFTNTQFFTFLFAISFVIFRYEACIISCYAR